MPLNKLLIVIVLLIAVMSNGILGAREAVSPITLDFIMGKFSPQKHPDFIKVSNKYASKKGMYLQKQTYVAFKKMYKAAFKDGVKLKIRSATRNFNDQKRIWERKWTGKRKVSGKNLSKAIPNYLKRAKKILRYSSMPGSSRHHWGTDIDLNSFSNQWFSTGKGLRTYQWLQRNAVRYGFCQVYSKKGSQRPVGYEEEKWHWSYLPLASAYTRFAWEKLRSDNYFGFKGSETASKIGIVENYVLGIAPECK